MILERYIFFILIQRSLFKVFGFVNGFLKEASLTKCFFLRLLLNSFLIEGLKSISFYKELYLNTLVNVTSKLS